MGHGGEVARGVSLLMLRIDELMPASSGDLRGGSAGVVEEDSIDEVVLACRIVEPDERGRRICQGAQALLAFAQRRLGAGALLVLAMA